MADKKLFTLPDAVIDGSMKIAFGKSGVDSKNATLTTLKDWVIQGSGSATQTAVFEIGGWNMQSSSISPLIGITVDGFRLAIERIVGVSVIIVEDGGKARSNFLSVQDGSALTVPQIQIGELTFIGITTIVTLQRRTSSWYTKTTSQSYTNTGINRGFVIVDYV